MIEKDIIIRNFGDIIPATTNHGAGEKRVLIANEETSTAITQVAVTMLKKGEYVETHSHLTMEEHFIFLEGECETTINGNMVMCSAGTFLKIPANTKHSLSPVTDIRMITIGIATEK